ncbi:MAG: hypothetical protein A2086_10575 [Spirochaetes bacterium GWD1_27_9]|nr:MAG: hypothetical protein A2Z98_17810 [Spirochaetes bacterium GWB1_27_13]OHD30921.1 MAG: hypothetical protein A2086_10575 [Spirochaetes bacterium GWD1_27_9]
MGHISIFYYFAVLTLGFTSLIVLLGFSFKTKNKLFVYLSFFHISYSILIFLFLFYSYLKTNIPDLFQKNIFKFMSFHFIAEALLLVSLIFFINYILKLNNARLINTIAVIIISINFIYHILLIGIKSFYNWYYGSNNAFFSSIIIITRDFVSISCIIYTIVIILLNYKKIPNIGEKKLLRNLIIICLIFLPGIIFDSVVNSWKSLIFVPLMYCVLSFIFVAYISKFYLKNYSNKDQDLRDVSLKENPNTLDNLNEVLKKYDISEREKDIILLIIKGYSNKDIGEKLFISPSTVKAHIYNIFRKIDVKNRHELTYKVLN